MLQRFAVISALAVVTFAVMPARSARRPRYGGTLRVEIGASIASLDPPVATSSPEEVVALAQIGPLDVMSIGARLIRLSERLGVGRFG